MGIFRSKPALVPKSVPITPKVKQTCPEINKCYETFIDHETGNECLQICLTHCDEWIEHFLSEMPRQVFLGVLPPWTSSYLKDTYWTVSYYIIHVYTSSDLGNEKKEDPPSLIHILLQDPSSRPPYWKYALLSSHSTSPTSKPKVSTIAEVTRTLCKLLTTSTSSHTISIDAYIDLNNHLALLSTPPTYLQGPWVVPVSSSTPLSRESQRLAKQGKSNAKISHDDKLDMLRVNFGPYVIPAHSDAEEEVTFTAEPLTRRGGGMK